MDLLKKGETEQITDIEEVMQCKWKEQLDFFSSIYILLAEIKRFFIFSQSWKQGEEHWL